MTDPADAPAPNPFLHEPAAQAWITRIEEDRTREADLYPRVRRWLAGLAGRRVLEVGAGQGACADHVDPGRFEYLGVEPAPALLARARERNAGTGRRFVAGDAGALPVPDASFDAALCVAVWHLLPEVAPAAAELARALTPGGALLIITAHPDAADVWARCLRDVTRDGRRVEGVAVGLDGSTWREVLHLHALEDVRAALEAAGFTDVRQSAMREVAPGVYQNLVVEARRG